MDRWKTKELKQMELGGNKNAKAFYEENFMYKDGKPDHEAPLHSRYKLELAAKAEAAIREEIQARMGQMPQGAPAQPVRQPAAAAQAIGGLQTDIF
mmetsp:Transcript_47925/g.63429  ORF Transcript_47925/g.63429 Transcript_47925/m.63429 type:complete len:96 (-) Transcript_47925:848-1135(-)|eukprot:CAMPEP_0170469884 /NCGR_PEP_ID=MMETSP0123-20130129/12555_1 /TAXON_ID=182087 /ORGANISM="Favella ehrenbergii, Strain Fehren 1" /LENGTH=95 /DNA_ID=CAMNT_0010736881 /DNA_START=378 /DNA_END=665 /DNA_ORIENTATION=-